MTHTAPTARVEDGLYLPEGASWWTRLRVALRALRVLEKRPDDTVAQPVFNASLDSETFARHVASLAETERGRALLAARPSLSASALDLEALRAMPEGTLGHALARYYADRGIAPFESPYEVRNDVDYIVKRYRETHDLVHVLTGYGTDALGEMEVQAFALGNLGLRTSALILTFAALLQPHGLPPMRTYLAKLERAFQRGRLSQSVLVHDYERYWGLSVEDARADGLLPGLRRATRGSRAGAPRAGATAATRRRAGSSRPARGRGARSDARGARGRSRAPRWPRARGAGTARRRCCAA